MIPRLIVEPPMTLEQTAFWTTADEQARAATFRNERRRCEYLTWRALVRRELGPDVRIGYNETGAPILPDGEAYLSVSHCEGRVAVCLSTRPCAVDIESASRNFLRVADRYMTSFERSLSEDPHWPGYVWCAKEALYKLAGLAGLDFRKDLRILAADLDEGRIIGRIVSGDPIALSAACRAGFLTVCCL